MTESLRQARKRMQQLLEQTTTRLCQANVLLERQTVLMQRLAAGHPGAELAASVHAEMARSVEILKWQCAWIDHHLRHPATMALQAQPHPWSHTPPPNLLQLCVEIERIAAADPGARDPDVTDRAIDAAIARAAAG